MAEPTGEKTEIGTIHYVIGAFVAAAVLFAIVGAIIGGGGDASDGLRSDASRSFAAAISRNLTAQDAASLRIACDAAESNLGGSRSNDQVKDWIDMAKACNDGLSGNWASGQDRMRSLLH